MLDFATDCKIIITKLTARAAPHGLDRRGNPKQKGLWTMDDRTRNTLVELFGYGLSILVNATDGNGIGFKFTPNNPLTGLFRANLARSQQFWSTQATPNPERPGLSVRGCGAYLNDGAPFDPAHLFPCGLGVIRPDGDGFKIRVLVLSREDPDLIHPDLPGDIRRTTRIWAHGLYDPDNRDPDEAALEQIAALIKSFCHRNKVYHIHLVASVKAGRALALHFEGDVSDDCWHNPIFTLMPFTGNKVVVVTVQTNTVGF